jgi:hypothetical protein
MLTDSISATPIANNGLKQGFEVLNKTSQDINQSLVVVVNKSRTIF